MSETRSLLERFSFRVRVLVGLILSFFSLFVIGALPNLITGWVKGVSPQVLINEILVSFGVFLVLSAIVIVAWIFLAWASRFDLFVFYKLWIDRLFPMFLQWQKKGGIRSFFASSFFWIIRYGQREIMFAEWIVKSKEFAEKRHQVQPGLSVHPVLIKREHLTRTSLLGKKYWPNWVFSIVMIAEKNKVAITIKENKWCLEIDLRGQSLGIYSNEGKKFLTEAFVDPIRLRLPNQTLGDGYHSTLMMKPGAFYKEKGDLLPLYWPPPNQRETPLRWSSGGVLPFVEYKEKTWVLLFFRDIPPIGLNVANGASEIKEDYKDIHKLIAREFSEEVMLLDQNPDPSQDPSGVFNVNQLIFTMDAFHPDAEPVAGYFSNKFARKHAELRRLHDNIRIVFNRDLNAQGQTRRNVIPIYTPYSIKVRYHRRTVGEKTQECGNVIFSLNPDEHGIEAIWLFKFPLFEGEYVLDGEFDPFSNFLIRRPVILIELDFLRKVFEDEKWDKKNSLGSCLGDKFQAGKELPEIPSTSFVLFDIDLELRKKRLDWIKNRLDKKIAKIEELNLRKEQNLLETWLKEYEQAFQDARKGNPLGRHKKDLRMLCPVAWKTLELYLISHEKL
ncbi:MAG: hypothetical protein ACFFDI_00515 [Promethearchaeota archaeon]